MHYIVSCARVLERPTAVIRLRARQSQLPTLVPQLCGEVWKHLRAVEAPDPGRLVALYLDDSLQIEVGAEVTCPVAESDTVVNSSLPAGLVATTTHLGPYNLLGNANRAILEWCDRNRHTLAGPSWEIYGHWTADPSRLRTDVHYLLRS